MNDQNAQMELYQRYHQPLYHAAYSILNNRDDAQDAMQEGMIKAFEKLDQFQGDGNPQIQKIKTSGFGDVRVAN